ncbi:unnamed protein product [Owenia fusiformis]|uniref:Uncharacterized protein n=1 Tax=Owenia fusiformis TaxID=6347 RepID=A0A8J1Y0I2_OWEFU|nr:unnamed protein product [Owenia fusiformis]
MDSEYESAQHIAASSPMDHFHQNDPDGRKHSNLQQVPAYAMNEHGDHHGHSNTPDAYEQHQSRDQQYSSADPNNNLPQDQAMANKPTLIYSHEMLSQQAQKLIDDINEKRKQDTVLMEDYRKSLELNVQKQCAAVEEHMFGLYETTGKTIQTKLQELYSTFDRIAKLEDELNQFKSALGMLYQDVNSSE